MNNYNSKQFVKGVFTSLFSIDSKSTYSQKHFPGYAF